MGLSPVMEATIPGGQAPYSGKVFSEPNMDHKAYIIKKIQKLLLNFKFICSKIYGQFICQKIRLFFNIDVFMLYAVFRKLSPFLQRRCGRRHF